ncbi:MAG: cytochrome c biogenesis protein ResB [Planctomycetota bacterium]|nr:cytochrome c biogenesis protein ResB [Planctomycetota bacterium]
MKKSIWLNTLERMGSQKVATVMMTLLLILTYLGTLEQAEHGLYRVQQTYFESWFLFHQFDSDWWFIPFEGWSFSIPLPGGLTCMIIFTINLLVGGILLLRLRKRTFGIFIIHVGIALMMSAGLVKLKASDEGYLQLWESQEAAEYISHHEWEVAVFETGKTSVDEHLVRMKRLAGNSELVIEPIAGLPFQLKLSGALPNCRALPVGPNWTPDSPAIDGWGLLKRPEVAENEQNLPGLTIDMIPSDSEDGPTQQALLWGGQNYPWTFEVADKSFSIALRKIRHSMPFSIRLDNFEKVDHPGISVAKEYRSDVTQRSEASQRKVRIEMNDPLRDQGLILFQSSWGPSNAAPGAELYSVFSVVRNPSDQWPLYSCIVIAIGMAITFVQKFLGYSKKQAKQHKEISQ